MISICERGVYLKHMNISQSLAQKQVMSLSQTQSLSILALSNEQLKEFLENEQLKNPLIEIDDSNSVYEKHISIGKGFNDRNSYGTVSLEQANTIKEIPTNKSETLKEHLLSQVDERIFDKNKLETLDIIIDSLDDDGFITYSPGELINFTKTSWEDIEECIAYIRTLDPCGIGAYSREESLLLQLNKKGIVEKYIADIINMHLDDLARGNYRKISQNLGISVQKVRWAFGVIKTLNPFVAQTFKDTITQYITPDILCEFVDGKWTAEINDKWIGSIKISDLYSKMYKKQNDPELLAYFDEKIRQAKFVMQSIEKRRKTMLDVTLYIVSHQTNNLLYKSPLKPLTLRDVATALEMHESTISRTIKNKYIFHARGTVSLKDLFTLASSGGEATSRNEVSMMIEKYIKDENKSKPYTDSDLEKLLSAEGFSVSRRTIAQYRSELGIGNAFARKSLM